MTAARCRLYFQAEGFVASPELLAHAHEKVEVLFRQLRLRAGRVRLQVNRECLPGSTHYAACVTTEKTGADHVAHATGLEPTAAVDASFTILERVLAASADVRKSQRRQA